MCIACKCFCTVYLHTNQVFTHSVWCSQFSKPMHCRIFPSHGKVYILLHYTLRFVRLKTKCYIRILIYDGHGRCGSDYSRGIVSCGPGQAGWGIAWYLNGTLIPHLHVQRGRTYTFIAESGTDVTSFDYHPFYLTDSRNGGRDTKSQARRDAETIYAGYDEDGNPYGSMCGKR